MNKELYQCVLFKTIRKYFLNKHSVDMGCDITKIEFRLYPSSKNGLYLITTFDSKNAYTTYCYYPNPRSKIMRLLKHCME